MIAHFPSPILSVAADAVKDLEGEDALSGLWALFTKCKESLKDGRRLENISWRLWYREMAASHHSPSSSPGSLSPPLSEKRSPSPITPISEDGIAFQQAQIPQTLLEPAADMTTAHSWHGNTPTPTVFSAGRRLSIASVPMERTKSHGSLGVGKMIMDILPGKLDVPLNLPSSFGEDRPTLPHIAQPRPVVALPTVQLPATPPSGAPRVVVVNPTPHPTPPATPHISHPPSPSPAPSARISTHLLPPPPARALLTSAAPMTKPALPPAIATAPAASSSSRGITSEQPKPRNDDTLKPSDRRFYLQQAGSPDGSSPQETPRTTSAKSSDMQERSPSSTSSHIKSEAAGHVSKRGSGQARKSKEVVRHAPVRPAQHRLHSHGHRQAAAAQKRGPTAEPKKTTFNIGSVSSNGSRSATGAPSKPAPHKETVAANPPPNAPNEINGAGPPRRGVVISTSSEYETDTDDDSEWASEDEAAEAGEKERRAREEARLREAAEEAQRQRDMFAKVPKRSYSNLNRTRSGLLSQLLNPDPNLFPPNHPYRNSFSTQDMTMLGRHGGGFTPIVATSKSSAAVPLAAQVTAQAPPTHVNGNGGYRPKGRPQGEELEDDSDSGEENTDNEIQLSRSIAQQKLAALADPNRRRYSDRGPSHHHQPVRPPLPSVATAPIPLGHPYNLPAPAPPMTPRTTRRQMLSTELSESLRRNLLWERQVSKINMTARRGVLGGGLRPLTAANPATNTSAANQHGRVNGGERADDREESKRRAMRNRSWADDYHYAGW